ncbi:MAG: FecR domain-containing protein [Kiritimatiellae bacterium]|nr:FecR domain-containing protein [Kiritimatiellia bacterium]
MHCEQVSDRLHEYLDGALGPGECAAFEAHVRDCSACRQALAVERAISENFRRLLTAQAATVTLGTSQMAARVRAELASDTLPEYREPVALPPSTRTRAPERAGRFAAPALPTRSRGWWLTAAAAVLLAALGLYVSHRLGGLSLAPSVTVSTVACIEVTYGDVRVVSPAYRGTAAPGQSLTQADSVETMGLGSYARLRCSDGSVIELDRQTQVGFRVDAAALRLHAASASGGRQVTLARGRLAACVRKASPENPVLFVTPDAVVVVRGTEFVLAAGPTGSHIDMREGEVALFNRHDNTTIRLGENRSAVIGRETLVKAEPLRGARDAAGRARAGLVALYTFHEGAGAIVHDISRVGLPLDLTTEDVTAVRWLQGGGLRTERSTVLRSARPATKIVAACRATHELTVEAWVKPTVIPQTGPARIVTLSAGTNLRNFTLGMDNNLGGKGWRPTDQACVAARLRTTNTSLNGVPAILTPLGSLTSSLTHLVFTRGTDGLGRIWINGVERARGRFDGDFSNWDDSFELFLARDLGERWPWLGEYFFVAIYNRTLAPSEVAAHFAAGLPGPEPGPTRRSDILPAPGTVLPVLRFAKTRNQK